MLPSIVVVNTTLPIVCESVKLLIVYTPEPELIVPVIFVPVAAAKVTFALLVIS